MTATATRSKRPLSIILAALMLAGLLVPLVQSPAHAATGTLSGTVTGEPIPPFRSGGGLAGICVEVYDSTSRALVAETETGTGGSYSVEVEEGTYKVLFTDRCGGDSQFAGVDYAQGWHKADTDMDGNADVVDTFEEGDAVSVAPDVFPSGGGGSANAYMVAGTSISGQVQEDGTGKFLDNICVSLYKVSNGYLVVQGATIQASDPENDGTYVIEGVPATPVWVLFHDDDADCTSPAAADQSHQAEWYDNVSTSAASQDRDQVDLSAGSASNVNASLAANTNAITGVVTEAETGDPLADICVDVYTANGNGTSPVGTTTTASNGSYSVGGLNGDYKVHFSDCQGAETHDDRWYDNKLSFSAANTVTVSGSVKGGINAQLPQVGNLGSISGTVTEGSTGLDGVCVKAYGGDGLAGTDITDGNGDYTVDGLPADTYNVQFVDDERTGDCTGADGDATHVNEWYDDQQFQGNADDVVLAEGGNVTNIDADLAANGGSLSGRAVRYQTVTDPSTGEVLEQDDADTPRSPAQNVCVRVYNTAGQPRGPLVKTDANGMWSVGGLAAGTYRVRYFDQDSDCPAGGLDPFTGEDTSKPDLYATIWYVEDTSGSNTPTSEGTPAFADADDVVLAADASHNTGQQVLRRAGQMSGTVRNTRSQNLIGICAVVIESDGDLYASDVSDADGNWGQAGVFPSEQGSDYKVLFADDETELDFLSSAERELLDCASADLDATHVGEWYLNKDSQGAATPISIVHDEETSGINGTLAETTGSGSGTASISGTVTESDPGAGPLDSPNRGVNNACVRLYDLSRDLVAETNADADGDYTLSQLDPGLYRVEFSDCTNGYSVTEWWRDQPDFESANAIELDAGESRTGIDAHLAHAGRISGRVQSTATSQGLEDVTVEVYTAEEGDLYTSTQTGANGSYLVGSLPPGEYKVFFQATATYRAEWYGDKPNFGSADVVTVAAKQTTSSIDASLANNRAPEAQDDEAQTAVNTPVVLDDLLDNDGDPDGDPIEITQVGNPSPHGTATLNSDGTVTYTPGNDKTATAVFSYTIEDPSGASDTASVTVEIVGEVPEGQPPIARDDDAAAASGEVVSIAVLENDTDPDGDDAALEITSVGTPLHGDVRQSGDDILYSSDEGFSGTDSFSYTITDEDGLKDTARVTVVVDSQSESAASRRVSGGETVSTDGTSATESNPLITSVTSPQTGRVTIDEDEDLDEVQDGDLTILGIRADITAPDASSPEFPIIIRFRIDGSQVTGNHPERTIQVLRDGVGVDNCYGETVPDPDPCITSRRIIGDDVLLTIRTTQASRWNFALSSQVTIERLFGSGRTETAVEVSQAMFAPSAVDTVLVARKDAYPDALAGGPLAAQENAPILLTNSTSLDDATRDEIERLGASRVIILGGTAAVSSGVENEIRSITGVEQVDRIAGQDRFETAAKIAAEVGPSSEVYVVEGADPDPLRGWPDALSVSPLAAWREVPILLVTTESIPTATSNALAGVANATIVGGTAAVNANVEQAIRDRGISVSRLAGDSRYSTSFEVAKAAMDAGMDVASTWFATGRNFPDALAAGPAVARDGGVFLLLDGQDWNNSERAETWLRSFKGSLEVVTLVGGEAVIVPSVRTAISNTVAR